MKQTYPIRRRLFMGETNQATFRIVLTNLMKHFPKIHIDDDDWDNVVVLNLLHEQIAKLMGEEE